MLYNTKRGVSKTSGGFLTQIGIRKDNKMLFNVKKGLGKASRCKDSRCNSIPKGN